MSSLPPSQNPWVFVKHHVGQTKNLPWQDLSKVPGPRPVVFLTTIYNVAVKAGGQIVNYGKMKVIGPAHANSDTQKRNLISGHSSLLNLSELVSNQKIEAIVIFEVRYNSRKTGHVTALGIPYPAPSAAPSAAATPPGSHSGVNPSETSSRLPTHVANGSDAGCAARHASRNLGVDAEQFGLVYSECRVILRTTAKFRHF